MSSHRSRTGCCQQGNPGLELVGCAVVKQTKHNDKLAYKAYVCSGLKNNNCRDETTRTAMKRWDFALSVVIWNWFSQQKVVKLFLQLIRSEAVRWSVSLKGGLRLKTHLTWRLSIYKVRLFREMQEEKLGLTDVYILQSTVSFFFLTRKQQIWFSDSRFCIDCSLDCSSCQLQTEKHNTKAWWYSGRTSRGKQIIFLWYFGPISFVLL